MPKVTKVKDCSALKKARNLISKGTFSESEESTDSEASEEYSHVPLKSDIPSINTINLNSKSTSDMDQVNAQLNKIMECMQSIQMQQQQHDQQINILANKIDSSASGNSSVHTQEATSATNGSFENLFKIPDPIKGLPTYDGNRRQLSAWLATAKETLEELQPLVTATQFKMYVRAVLNKIEGRAKDILCLAGNPQSFTDVSEILTNAIGDRQELSTYMSQIWQNKMNENITIHKYHQKTKEYVQSMKILAKQNSSYKQSWDAISLFIDEFALAAFIAGLRDPYFGHVQAARPKDIEDAYAFLCKFKSQQITASRTENMEKKYKFKINNNNQRKPNDEIPKEKNHIDSKFHQHPKPSMEGNEKMEIDPSQKSRLTLNRKYINNNEIELESDDSQSEDDETLAINFSSVGRKQTET